MYNNKLKAIVLPVVIALAIVLGMGINSLLDHKEVPVNMGQRMIGSKLDYILNMINYSYVDSVDIHKIEEDAIPQILNDLDPHTVYIPAKDMQRVNEEMVGNFGGVGVQFYKYLDTVTVVKVVPGGPSEAAGLQDGDRIVKVNDSIVAGRNMNTDKITVSDAGRNRYRRTAYDCPPWRKTAVDQKYHPGKYSYQKCGCGLYVRRYDRVYQGENLRDEYL